MMDYIRSLLTLIFAVSIMFLLLDCDVKNKKKLTMLGLVVVAMVICDSLFIYYFSYASFMRLYPLLIQLPVFSAFVILSRFNIIKVLFVHLTTVAITSSFTLFGLIISTIFRSDWTTVIIVCYILYLPIWFIIYKYMRPSFLYMLRHANKGWLGFCTIPLSCFILTYITTKYNPTMDTFTPVFLYAVLLFIMSISAYFLIFRIFTQTREQLTLQNEQDLLITQVSAAQTHLEALKESQEKAIIYRHDMRHHLNLIGAYLADNNKTAAQKYIADVGLAIGDTAVPQYCVNYTVNLILYFYISKAKNDKIKVETQIDLAENSPVSDMDLCVIFSNAIENATNACKKLTNAEDRFLNITCTNKDGKLYIQITNTYTGDVIFADAKPVRTIENHGLGIKSILTVAEKYGGLCSFTTADGLFNARIIL